MCVNATVKIITMEGKTDDLTEILTQAINKIKMQQGEKFELDKINLAELERLTGITRAKLRRLKENGFVEKPHGLLGRKADRTVLTGYTGIVDTLLKAGITNSSVCFDRLKEAGYQGGLTTVKTYIAEHQDLIPSKRQIVAPQGNRGRRYQTAPGESYQMDWGFVNVETEDGSTYKAACFAMICHCCGKRYIEFFPNARQENLFIGMIHAFLYMGIPQYVLTDNMRSVVNGRDSEGHPIWQKDYELFMGNIGFETKLCKPRHPFTKGAVERLVRFVKDNFLPGRIFHELTDLNYEAIAWCERQNKVYHKAVDSIPDDKHEALCMRHAYKLDNTIELAYYLCPERKISFDGFVNYEGRRFGVPFWYTRKTCRVKRDGYILYIYDDNMTKILTSHNVTWSRKDSYCKDQYTDNCPEEHPTAPVKIRIQQMEPRKYNEGFEKFNFEEGLFNE